jgi:hypothetical protein
MFRKNLPRCTIGPAQFLGSWGLQDDLTLVVLERRI